MTDPNINLPTGTKCTYACVPFVDFDFPTIYFNHAENEGRGMVSTTSMKYTTGYCNYLI